MDKVALKSNAVKSFNDSFFQKLIPIKRQVVWKNRSHEAIKR
jgi:hypothetical protein